MQQKWNSLDEGSRLTLNLLSKEIDLRNGEVKKGVIGMKQILEGVYIYRTAWILTKSWNLVLTLPNIYSTLFAS